MKLNTQVSELTISNVGTTGEFRIRNSAKAFAILSSGLYSNKIRAIIRELSCNAIDSHVAAGKLDVPFEVHLPNTLEPYFYVRDFGQGLDGHQVMNIYTTYFESTKTGSDDYIGALGLGSKSPFSYTENFTITAIKNGVRRVFTAYINQQGIPSVAEMEVSETTEDNGVEVKFSVNNSHDYRNFAHEAQQVFMWFKNRPTITGSSQFRFIDPEYRSVEIVPGVNILKSSYESYAVMGNICYPLGKIPNPEQAFGELYHLLNAGLVIEFKIGELDIAASREELSYIPETIANIKKRLIEVSGQIYDYIKREADKIENLWDRAYFLVEQGQVRFMRASLLKYISDTKFPLVEDRYGIGLKTVIIPEKYLLDKFGITMKGFQTYSSTRASTIKLAVVVYGKDATDLGKQFDVGSAVTGVGSAASISTVSFHVNSDATFVLGDIKTSPNRRATYHVQQHSHEFHGKPVFVLTCNKPTIEEKEESFKAFLKLIHDPKNVIKASTMSKPVLAPREKKTFLDTVLAYEHSYRRGNSVWSWVTPTNLPDDEDETYVYVLMKGWEHIDAEGKPVTRNLDYLIRLLENSGMKLPTIHAVRKTQFTAIKDSENWVYLDDYMKETVAKYIAENTDALVSASELDSISTIMQNALVNPQVLAKLGKDSPARKFSSVYLKNGASREKINLDLVKQLCNMFGVEFEFEASAVQFKKAVKDILRRYEMLQHMTYHTPENVVSNYINLVDKKEQENE